MKEGSWPEDSQQRAFVEGVKWWEFHKTGATLWPSDRDLAEKEAVKKYGEVKEEEVDIREFKAFNYFLLFLGLTCGALIFWNWSKESLLSRLVVLPCCLVAILSSAERLLKKKGENA